MGRRSPQGPERRSSGPREEPLVVSGADHSGTTWMGRMLAMAPSLTYIHEPFNVGSPPGRCAADFDTWYRYVCEENETPELVQAFRDTLEFRFNTLAGLRDAGSLKDIVRLGRDWLTYLFSKLARRRPLLKDPIAVFSLEWLEKRFAVLPIIIIRHPLGYAGSRKKHNHHHPFDHFLRQSRLLCDHLSSYRHEIESFAREEKSIVEEAVLLWRLMHSVIRHYRKSHPHWIFVRHEDLCQDPIREFARLYKEAGLKFGSKARRRIAKYCTGQGEVFGNDRLERSSGDVIYNWCDRLTPKEIDHIQERTAELRTEFYSDSYFT